MNNIQKIADEIFKGPTEDEKFDRIAEDGTFMQVDYLNKFFHHEQSIIQKEAELKSLFPKGISYFAIYAQNFRFLVDYIQKCGKNKKLFARSSNIQLGVDWHSLKVRDRNILQEDFFGKPIAFMVEVIEK